MSNEIVNDTGMADWAIAGGNPDALKASGLRPNQVNVARRNSSKWHRDGDWHQLLITSLEAAKPYMVHVKDHWEADNDDLHNDKDVA